MKIVLLAGAPGSGKSSQGKSLIEKNANIKHISIGEDVITSAHNHLLRSQA